MVFTNGEEAEEEAATTSDIATMMFLPRRLDEREAEPGGVRVGASLGALFSQCALFRRHVSVYNFS